MRKTVGKIAIALLFSLPLFLPGSWLFSQSAAANRPELDHTTVFVRDLPKSVEFYEKVVGLERIPDPFKDGRHIWFRSGAHQQLHVQDVGPGGIHQVPAVGSEDDVAIRARQSGP